MNLNAEKNRDMFCAFLSREADAAFGPHLADHEGSRTRFGGSIFRSWTGFWAGVWEKEGAHAHRHLNFQMACCPLGRRTPWEGLRVVW